MKALIFDMDGVVIDSEKYWDAQEFGLFQKIIPEWNREKHKSVVGLNIPDTYKVLSKAGVTLSEQKFALTIDRLAKNIYRTKAELMPGFLDLKNEINKRKIPVGLASSSRFTWINMALKKLGLENFFDTITSSQEIKGQGKPAPDLYLLAAKKIGFKPNECVAIEDSANGLKASRGAGLATVITRTGYTDDHDFSGALALLPDLGEVSVPLLRHWHSHAYGSDKKM